MLEAGLAGKVLVTGQDAELAACQRIAAGTQTMTIYKPIRVLAAEAASAAVALAQGKPLIAAAGVDNGKVTVPSILEKVYVVTRDNLRDTVVKDKFLTEAEVFGTSPGR